jgi:hypothetical protein
MLCLQIAVRSPLYDQVAANKYTVGQGLKPHVDLALQVLLCHAKNHGCVLHQSCSLIDSLEIQS